MLDTLKTNHGVLKFPVFFPDATEGVVKSVDSIDLKNCKVQGLVTNISDSEGFQVMSLVRDNNFGEIHDDKIVFKLNGQKTILTPEKSIRAKFKLFSRFLIFV